jgi:hypothetical protein
VVRHTLIRKRKLTLFIGKPNSENRTNYSYHYKPTTSNTGRLDWDINLHRTTPTQFKNVRLRALRRHHGQRSPLREPEGGGKMRRRVVEPRRHLPCGLASFRRPLRWRPGEEATLEGQWRRGTGVPPEPPRGGTTRGTRSFHILSQESTGNSSVVPSRTTSTPLCLLSFYLCPTSLPITLSFLILENCLIIY